jgi:hypothetical protein
MLTAVPHDLPTDQHVTSQMCKLQAINKSMISWKLHGKLFCKLGYEMSKFPKTSQVTPGPRRDIPLASSYERGVSNSSGRYMTFEHLAEALPGELLLSSQLIAYSLGICCYCSLGTYHPRLLDFTYWGYGIMGILTTSLIT